MTSSSSTNSARDFLLNFRVLADSAGEDLVRFVKEPLVATEPEARDATSWATASDVRVEE